METRAFLRSTTRDGRNGDETLFFFRPAPNHDKGVNSRFNGPGVRDDVRFSDRYATRTGRETTRAVASCQHRSRRTARGPRSRGGGTRRRQCPAAAASAAMAQTLSEWASGRTCDWCQEECDLDACDLNVLTCSFRGGPSQDSDDNNSVYHKECVEAYLKSSTERRSAKYVEATTRRRRARPSDPRTRRTAPRREGFRALFRVFRALA